MNTYILKFKDFIKDNSLHGGIMFALFSFFSRGVSFILLIILAEYINPKQYGMLSVYTTINMFLGYFVGLSTIGYFSVSYFKENTHSFKKDFSAICVISIVTSILITFILIISKNLIVKWDIIPYRFFLIGLQVAFCNTFLQLLLDYFRVKGLIKYYGFISCTYTILCFILSIYLVVYTNLKWEGRIYSQLVSDLVFAVVAICFFYKNKLYSFSWDFARYKKIIMWGLPIIPHLASVWIRQGLDRFIIEHHYSMSDVGVFSFALNISSIILVIGTAFNQVNSVDIYKILSSEVSETEKHNLLKKKERIFICLYLIITVIIAIFVNILVPILLPMYILSIEYISYLSIFALFQCIYLVYCNYLFYFNRTKKLMYITFSSSILHLLLSLILTKYSLILTCMIYIFTQGVVCLLVYMESRNCLKRTIASS